MKDNIPAHAVKFTYDYGGQRGSFYVWDRLAPLGTMSVYQWSALGNNGEELTYETAIAAARNWIRSSITKQ